MGYRLSWSSLTQHALAHPREKAVSELACPDAPAVLEEHIGQGNCIKTELTFR